jgi:hypothetical protein
VRAVSASTIALFLIFAAILLLTNEVRFQSCVSRDDSAALINATDKAAKVSGPACHRVPFVH